MKSQLLEINVLIYQTHKISLSLRSLVRMSYGCAAISPSSDPSFENERRSISAAKVVFPFNKISRSDMNMRVKFCAIINAFIDRLITISKDLTCAKNFCTIKYWSKRTYYHQIKSAISTS